MGVGVSVRCGGPVLDGDRSCIKCGCRQSDEHPFVHRSSCPTVESRQTVDPARAATLFRMMTAAPPTRGGY